MKAIVFAAGLGTRLRPFTNEHPKALVEVGGEPMLGHVLRKLIAAGVNDVIINVHHFPEQITDYLKANNNFGINISISDESDLLLDTGGALIKAEKLIDLEEPLMIHNADILTDFPVEEMLGVHERTGADATLLMAERKTSRYLCFDNEYRLKGWINMSTGASLPAGYIPDSEDIRLAFGGVHIINPKKIIPGLKKFATSEVFSIIPFYSNNANELDIKAYLPSKPYRWHDIGKPESLEAARKEFIMKNSF